jgi:hypothetical protein
MITTCYLHSHLTWDRLCQSCIGSSFLPRGAFLGGRAYAISRRQHHAPLKALRVARPEAVGLERTNCEAAPRTRTAQRRLHSNRGDTSPFGLFLAGVRGWEVELRRHMADRNPGPN